MICLLVSGIIVHATSDICTVDNNVMLFILVYNDFTLLKFDTNTYA